MLRMERSGTIARRDRAGCAPPVSATTVGGARYNGIKPALPSSLIVHETSAAED
jgi:hypothetical protein